MGFFSQRKEEENKWGKLFVDDFLQSAGKAKKAFKKEIIEIVLFSKGFFSMTKPSNLIEVFLWGEELDPIPAFYC